MSTGKQKIASAKDVVDTAVGTVDQAFPIVREIIHAGEKHFSFADQGGL